MKERGWFYERTIKERMLRNLKAEYNETYEEMDRELTVKEPAIWESDTAARENIIAAR